MANPYDDLPAEAFWRPAVAERRPEDIAALWTPKWRISRRDRIVTAGSCFAQHIGRALAARGYRWWDAEPAPAGLPRDRWGAFHYGTFSFRTGNIYTPNMLAQWLAWAFGATEPAEEIWSDAGRHWDPFRPAVEPGGFVSAAEMLASRAVTLAAIRSAVQTADVFVFTLGLTESWQHAASGVEYAVCPGTVAGKFKPRFHKFVNHDYAATHGRLVEAIVAMRAVNPKLRVLLTVSPVPLTATASGQHVLVATGYSKAVLRAVAGAVAEADPLTDYFPSYEIITGAPFRAGFYAANLRQVTAAGVEAVMDRFFADQERVHGRAAPAEPPAPVSDVPAPDEAADDAADLRCEEEMLDAFSR